MTPEQRQKLHEMAEAKEKARVQRIQDLEKKLILRIRPFVEAKHPGEKEDEETKKFEESQRREAEDLKLESFGVEVSRVCFACGRRDATRDPFEAITLTSARFLRPTAPAHYRIRLHLQGVHLPQVQALLRWRVPLEAQGEGNARQGGLGRARIGCRSSDGHGGDAKAAGEGNPGGRGAVSTLRSVPSRQNELCF